MSDTAFDRVVAANDPRSRHQEDRGPIGMACDFLGEVMMRRTVQPPRVRPKVVHWTNYDGAIWSSCGRLNLFFAKDKRRSTENARRVTCYYCKVQQRNART